METKKVYLDYSASTPLHSEVLEEMIKIEKPKMFGNPFPYTKLDKKAILF